MQRAAECSGGFQEMQFIIYEVTYIFYLLLNNIVLISLLGKIGPVSAR